MGLDQSPPGKEPPVSELDAAVGIVQGVVQALNRIASAIEANAAATNLLARATAGEFDAENEPLPIDTDLRGRPLR